MERALWPPQGRLQLDTCKHRAANPAAVREHRDSGAVRQELLARRSQPCEPPAPAEERQPEIPPAELHADVAAVDEAQLEHATRPVAVHGERACVDASHDPASDANIDHDADPHPNPDVMHPERPRRQERERRVISGRGPPRRCRDDMESRLRAGREPEPPRAQAEPRRCSAGGPYTWLAP
jgi:hypothetical protein